MTESATFYEQLTALEHDGAAFVFVVLTESLGSTPQDTGAKMIVTAPGLHAGPLGGGKVEAKAVARAQEMIAAGAATPRFVNWALKTDVGIAHLDQHLVRRGTPDSALAQLKAGTAGAVTEAAVAAQAPAAGISPT